MTTPSKETLWQAKEAMRQYVRERTYRGSDGLMRHHGCGALIQFVPAYLSIHNVRFSGCAGAGRVQVVPIPYCPKCEPTPAPSGCIHVPGETNPLLIPGEPTE